MTVTELCTELGNLTTEIVCQPAQPSFLQTQIAHGEVVGGGLFWSLIGIVLVFYILKHVKFFQELVFTYFDNLKTIVTKYNNTPDEITETDKHFAKLFALSGLGGSILVAGVFLFFGLLAL